jgi:hypothetical protein
MDTKDTTQARTARERAARIVRAGETAKQGTPRGKWAYLGTITDGGHRLWMTGDDLCLNIYIADRSGDGYHGEAGNPDETDDGRLVIRTDYPLRIEVDREATRTRCIIPLLTPNQKHIETVTDSKGIAVLARALGMTVEIEGTPFVVRMGGAS